MNNELIMKDELKDHRLVKAEGTFIARKILAAYVSYSDKTTLAVMTDDSEPDSEADGVDLATMMGQLENAIGVNDSDKSSITDLINSVFDSKKLKFKLKELQYINVTPNGSDKETDNSYTKYAFAIDVNYSSDSDINMKFISVDSLSLALWNTNDDGIKKKMGIDKLLELLDSEDESNK